MGLSNKFSVRLGVSPAAPSNHLFSISGLRLYFPTLEPWVAQSVTWSSSWCLAGQLQLCLSCSTIRLRWVHQPAATLLRVLSSWLPVSAPPTSLDECFFFISLVVGLPYSLIFCQFWLFFVFKLLLSFFWLCEEAHYVYLCLHLAHKS